MGLVLHSRPSGRNRQQGYFLLVLMLLITLVLITLSASLPGVVGQLRHDREDEMIHRGVQYARAVRLYYKKTNSYPVSIDQLKETNHKRYLRRVYKDPITGGDFRPLRGSDVTQAGVRPTAGDTTGAGGSGSMASGATPNSSSGSGTNPSSGSSSPDQTGTPPATNSPPTSSASTMTGGSVTSTSPFGTLSGGTNPGSATTAASNAAGVLGAAAATGQVFGGGAIVGVASLSPKKAFHIYNNKDHYREWMFIYDPSAEGKGLIKGPYNGPQTTSKGTIPGATPAGQLSSPSSSSSSSSTGFGSSSFGQSPTTPTSPTR